MPTRFHLKLSRDEAIDVQRWLYTNVGPQVKEVIPKKNIKVKNWECHYQYTNWQNQQLMVEVFSDTDAVAFKLTWCERITRERQFEQT